MMNNLTFTTQGSWETTTLTRNGEQVAARAIYLKLTSVDFNEGDDGGTDSGIIVDEARVVIPRVSQDEVDDAIDRGNFDLAYSLCSDEDIFPGLIEFITPSTAFRVELTDPTMNSDNFRFFMEGIDITDDICEVEFNIDSINNTVSGWFSYVSDRGLFGRFDTTTVTVL